MCGDLSQGAISLILTSTSTICVLRLSVSYTGLCDRLLSFIYVYIRLICWCFVMLS